VTTRPLRVRHSRGPPRTLTEEQLLTLVEACEHLRDRFLLVLLAESAMFSRGRPWGRGLCSGCSRCSEACWNHSRHPVPNSARRPPDG